MKITVPVATKKQVGTFYGVTTYTDGRTPSTVTTVPTRPVYEYGFTDKVLLDNDFQAARRITGLGHLTYKSVLAVTVAPVLIGGTLVVGILARIGLAIADEVRELAVDIPEAVADIHRSITGVLKGHLQDVIG